MQHAHLLSPWVTLSPQLSGCLRVTDFPVGGQGLNPTIALTLTLTSLFGPLTSYFMKVYSMQSASRAAGFPLISHPRNSVFLPVRQVSKLLTELWKTSVLCGILGGSVECLAGVTSECRDRVPETTVLSRCASTVCKCADLHRLSPRVQEYRSCLTD